MTLHPWPSSGGPNDRHSVIWKNGSALGLLTDTLAVPLRFDGASAGADAATPVPAPMGDAHLPACSDTALLRVRHFESRIGCAVT